MCGYPPPPMWCVCKGAREVSRLHMHAPLGGGDGTPAGHCDDMYIQQTNKQTNQHFSIFMFYLK